MPHRGKSRPEVMSPAGYWPQLHAAIEAGADAVYFGLKHFTARAKAGFTPEELGGVMRTLHARGVKGYVTFNTLVFDEELSEAADALEGIAKAGADAIIVQDLGIAKLARRIAPELELHASTQMSLTSAEGINFAMGLGIKRVVMARELSLKDVEAIAGATDCELEMFVHGALCVSYSGQCFSSEAWGGRSANRGQCAQACRLPYEMVVDGEVRPLGDARYLLSPGDLFALHQLPEMVRLGISALKIEGRYKDADYVALTTSAYRKAVDEVCAGMAPRITAAEELRLAQVYSRGFGAYFVNGTDHQAVVPGRAPRHRGVKMGRVVRAGEGAVVIEAGEAQAIAPLKPGDGVVFDAAGWRSPEEREEGGRIYQVETRRDGRLELRFGNGAIDFGRIRSGDWVWRTDDPDIARLARTWTEATAPVFRQPVRVKVRARAGERLWTEWAVDRRWPAVVVVESEALLGRAERRAIDEALVRDQLGRLGNTAYELAGVEMDVEGQPFAPASLLNLVRRLAVERLEAAQEAVARIEVQSGGEALASVLSELDAPVIVTGAARMHLLVRNAEQLDAAIALRPAGITLDYLELYGLAPSVERVLEAGIEARVASPRVLKPAEERIVHFLLKLGCGILVRSTGLLASLTKMESRPLTGDFSLNAANRITASDLLATGLERVTPTHDLNGAQVERLAREVGGARLEAIVYHHLPVFHTEHCVFCRFLSQGHTFEDCGHPCEKHRVALRDVNGREHPVVADVGCRNTVFGAEAQQAARHLDAWRAAGVRDYRLEFVHESGEQVSQIAGAFARWMDGRMGAVELERKWEVASPRGVTEGSLFVPVDSLGGPPVNSPGGPPRA